MTTPEIDQIVDALLRQPDHSAAIFAEALQRIVDKRDAEDVARLIASKALGDAVEYLNTGEVKWRSTLPRLDPNEPMFPLPDMDYELREGGESVPGLPDPEVERLQRAVEHGQAVNTELNEELGYQIQRADQAEERLRAVTEAARGLFEALEPWAILPELPASESRVLDAADALRTVLSSHPEAAEPDSGIPQ